MKEQKGITLVALVITIIVMLILVVVTVTVAKDGGLFATARKAKTDTQAAADKEREYADGKIDGKTLQEIADGTTAATTEAGQ